MMREDASGNRHFERWREQGGVTVHGVGQNMWCLAEGAWCLCCGLSLHTVGLRGVPIVEMVGYRNCCVWQTACAERAAQCVNG